MSTVPTLDQSHALGELVRRGELTDEHRHLAARLLDVVAPVA